MFIYNVTMKVDWEINDAWLNWMLNEHMPAVINTKCFTTYHLLKLHDVDDMEGPTYAAQYYTDSKALYNRYLELHAQNFVKDTNNKWQDHVIMFRTFMEIIS